MHFKGFTSKIECSLTLKRECEQDSGVISSARIEGECYNVNKQEQTSLVCSHSQEEEVPP